MERCPQCRARLKDKAVCARCGSDLSLLLAIESQAALLARQSVRSLLAGADKEAAEQAGAARRLDDNLFHQALDVFLRNRITKSCRHL